MGGTASGAVMEAITRIASGEVMEATITLVAEGGAVEVEAS